MILDPESRQDERRTATGQPQDSHIMVAIRIELRMTTILLKNYCYICLLRVHIYAARSA